MTKTHPNLIELRPYQEEDCARIMQYKAFACFNEQRTGKTPTALQSLVRRDVTKILVVCPKSAVYPWVQEAERWTGLPAVACVGTKAKRDAIISDWKNGVLVTSYGALKRTRTSEGALDLILKNTPQGVILDEAHRIKDRNSANAKAAFELSKIEYKIALTGTPAPNKPDEIWSILHFLYPKQFTSYWNFVNKYLTTFKMRNSSGKQFIEITGIKPSEVQNFVALLNKCSTQRKRKDVMSWLPEKEHQRILLPPTKEQTRYLTELRKYFETEHVVTQTVLDRLIRYRQICLDPMILNLKSKSPKTEWILDYLKDYPDKPTIIFSKFTTYIDRLKEQIDKPYGVIVGATPAKQRALYIKAFQTGIIDLLIIQIDAGKEALTLDRAEAIIFTDKFPPVGDIEQAEDRFIATTEEKANKAHVIYELVLKGTYDEQIYELLEERASAVDAINNFKKYMKGD